MTQYMTEWVTLVTAGKLRGGREVTEKNLIDAAQTYDRNEYRAMINSEHRPEYGNFGQVHDVRLKNDAKGRKTLQARLVPNQRFFAMNAEGRRQSLSVELDLNFMDSGRSYLIGVALTDQPASVGTSFLKLSHQNTLKSDSIESSFTGQPTSEHDAETSESGLLTKLTALLNGAPKSPPQQDDTMTTPEKTLTAQADIQALQEQTQKLSTQIEVIQQQLAAHVKPQPADTQKDEGEGVDTTTMLLSMQTQQTQLAQSVETLTKTLKATLQEQPSPHIDPAAGDASTDNFIGI